MAKYGLIKGTRLNYSVKQFKKELEFLKQHENISEKTYNKLSEFINDIDKKNEKCMEAFSEITIFNIFNIPKILGSHLAEMIKPDATDYEKDKRKQIAKEKADKKNTLTNEYSTNVQGDFSKFKAVRKAFKGEYKSQKKLTELKECLEALGCVFEKEEADYNGEFEINFYNSFSEIRLSGDLSEKLEIIFKDHQFVKLKDETSDELTEYVANIQKDNIRELNSYLRQLKQYIPEAANKENTKDDIRNLSSSIEEVRATETRRDNIKPATDYLKRNYRFMPLPILKMYFEWKNNLYLLIGFTDENIKKNKEKRKEDKKRSKLKNESELAYLKRECQESSFFLGKEGGAQEHGIIPFFKNLLICYGIEEEMARSFDNANVNELNDELQHKFNIYNNFKTNFILPQVEEVYKNDVQNSVNYNDKESMKQYIQMIFRGYNAGSFWGRNKTMPAKLEEYINKANDSFNLREGKKGEELKKLFIKYDISVPSYLQFADNTLDWSNNLTISRDEFCVNNDRNLICVLVEMLKDTVGEYPPGVEEIRSKRDTSFAQPVNPKSVPPTSANPPSQTGQKSMWIR